MFSIDIIPGLPLPLSSVATPSHSSSLALSLSGINDAVAVSTTGKVDTEKDFKSGWQPEPNTVHIEMGTRRRDDEIYFQSCRLWKLHVSSLPSVAVGNEIWFTSDGTRLPPCGLGWGWNLFSIWSVMAIIRTIATWCGGNQSAAVSCSARQRNRSVK